jgi:hypothetical protein
VKEEYIFIDQNPIFVVLQINVKKYVRKLINGKQNNIRKNRSNTIYKEMSLLWNRNNLYV